MFQPKGKPRRSLKGFLIRPRQQLKLSFGMLAATILFLAVLMALFTMKMYEEIEILQGTNPPAAAYLQNLVAPMLEVLLTYLLTLGFVSILVGVMLSHRIYGPIVPIVRHIQALRNGDYKSRLHLRKNDELGEIADELNSLAEVMEKSKT